MNARTSAIIGGIGRSLITLGCLTLAFAAFQLWGTGIAENRAQNQLEGEFSEARLAYATFAEANGVPVNELGAEDTPDTIVLNTPDDIAPESPVQDAPSQPGTPAADVPDSLRPKAGDALGVIRIPSLDVHKVVIAGTRRTDLRQGPGHYAQTPLPGQAGNAAIAGHRTTYGAPFGDIDQLVPGDQIITETFQGTFYYEVLPQTSEAGVVSGHAIVTPYEVQVLDNYGDNRLTLTACHPKYSARQRIIVQARLIDAPAATIDILGDDLDEFADADVSEEQLAYDAGEVDAAGFGPDGSQQADADNPVLGAESEELDCATCVESDEGNAVGNAPEALDEALGWHMEELTPFILWSLATGFAASVAIVAARRLRRWPTYFAASPVVFALLYFSFTHLDRMLPAF